MAALFEKLLSMSAAAGWMVLAVVVLRLALCRAPKWTRCWLWALVGVRLVLPVSLKSPLSLVPRSPVEVGAVLPEAPAALPQQLLQGVGGYPAAAADAPAAGPELTAVLSWLWLAGVLLLLGYALFSVIRLRRRVSEAVLLEGRVW